MSNTGHGHVIPRADGAKARCGGPALCLACQIEKASVKMIRTMSQSDDEFEGVCKGHIIHLSRDDPNACWYIRVAAPNGCYAYDGWWQVGTVEAAKAEALRGAGLTV